MNVGERIKFLREQKGITVNRLANMAGLSQSFLREIELGNKNPTVETLSYFCDALGVSLAEFFSEDNKSIYPALLTEIKKMDMNKQIALAEFLNMIN